MRPLSLAAVLAGLMLAVPGAAAIKQVVLLQSLERGTLVLDRFTATLRAHMGERSADSLTFTEFVVNPSGFTETPEEAMVDYLREAFTGRPRPDLLITIGGPAAAFARKHRHRLFPDSPTVYASLDQRFLHDVSFTDNETTVAADMNQMASVGAILEVLPDTESVFVITGAGTLGRFWRAEFERYAVRFKDRLRFIWADGMSYAAMLQRASTLPPRSAIYFNSFDVDADGGTFSTARVLGDLQKRANAPIFGAQTAELGHGLVGGRLLDIDELARVAAEVASRILDGEVAASMTSPIHQLGPPMFDWRELNRWGIREDRLPAGSVIRFREAGVWERYRWIIAGSVSALVAQSLLITTLLVNRARRRRAEQSLRESEGRLSNLNRRLMEAQEQERSRLARELHDDVCQQTTVLALELNRLAAHLPESETAARRQAAALSQDASDLGNQLNAISHRLHSSKLDLLGLAAAAGAFCRETSSHHGVTVEFVHENVPATLPDDVAINVFRVLQEALTNAVKHSGAARYAVTLRGTDDQLRLEVRDSGRGFDPRVALVTSGLGLVSMQERLGLVNGTVSIESAPGAGTTVRAVIPTSMTAVAEGS